MPASLERELQLRAPYDFQLPAMDGALPGLSDGAPVRMELDATYFDTPDLRLARTGVTVRLPRPAPHRRLPRGRTRTNRHHPHP